MACINSFDFSPGRQLARRYEVIGLLGAGWESEVYLIREKATGVERAAKLFFPQRNQSNKVAKLAAKKLHQLRNCSALIQYVAQETITFQRQPVTMMISEYVDGQLLNDFIADHPGKRLHQFEALHLLHALAMAMEPIHLHREYHGDLHPGNIIIRRVGLGFDVKLIDLHHHNQRKIWSIHDDVWDLIKIFYDALGGSRFYSRHPIEIKQICRGLKRTLVAEKYRNAGQLRRHLETIKWE